MKVDELLKEKPYCRFEREDFLFAMREILKYHYENSEYFRRFLDAQKFSPDEDYNLEDIPFLPTSIFKELELITGNPNNVKKRAFSSSTTGHKPSIICLDQITIDRQRIALSQIMGDFLGNKRRVFIIFDSPETILSSKGEVSSRGSAIRGMLLLANRYFFVLKDNLSLNLEEFQNALASAEEEGICFFGFTWVIYRLFADKEPKKILVLSSFLKNATMPKTLMHIGGWKKLRDLNVGKEDFNKLIIKNLFVGKEKIIDVYGLTEQLGTVYPDCPFGFKHVPLYADVIVRNSENFLPVALGEEGFLQFLTPIPNSYPGISVLSDDIGEIIGLDGCQCGRRGKFFVFRKRYEAAELRGCGDTI